MRMREYASDVLKKSRAFPGEGEMLYVNGALSQGAYSKSLLRQR